MPPVDLDRELGRLLAVDGHGVRQRGQVAVQFGSPGPGAA